MIILSLLLSSLLFLGKKSPTVHAESGSTEMTNRVLRKYPSKDTYTRIGAYKQSEKPKFYDEYDKPAFVANPGGMFVIPSSPNPGKTKSRSDFTLRNNNANYWSEDVILGEKGQSAAGMIRTQNPVSILDEDFEFTFCNQVTRYINADFGFAVFFTSDLDFVSKTGYTAAASGHGNTYGALGLYSRYGLDDKNKDKFVDIIDTSGMKNAIAVEFDSRNQMDESGPDTKRIDGLTVDQYGNEIPIGDRGDHVAITFPQESQYTFLNNPTGVLYDGTQLPSYYPKKKC